MSPVHAIMLWFVIGAMAITQRASDWPFILLFGVVGLVDALVWSSAVKTLETKVQALENPKEPAGRVFDTDWAENWRKQR